MLRNTLRTLTLAALLSGVAGATNLDFSVAYRTPGSGLNDQLWGRLGVSELDLLGGQFSAGVSNRAADIGFTRGLSLAPLGSLTARTDFMVSWQGGVRLASRVSGGLGPVALNVGGAYFSAPVTVFDPLAAWAFTPNDLRDRGWNADLSARYRVNRTLVAVAGGEFGAQPNGFAGIEGRRELTRTLPPAPDSDPDAEADTESLGSLAWRFGVRGGREVLGVTAGLTYATESGLSVGLDGLLGPASLGLTGSLSAPDVLGEGSLLRLYAAYEPWRTASTPLRAGLDATLKAGPGNLSLNVAGGRTALGSTGFGVKVAYSLPLGGITGSSDQNP